MNQNYSSPKNTLWLPATATVYNISPADDIINVNTSLNPVILYLPNIKGSGLDLFPKNFYINDVSNNAGANNITIYGLNNTVNGSSTTINANGASGECVIVAQTEWLVNKSYDTSSAPISGTPNRISKFDNPTGLVNSLLFDNGSTVAIDSGKWITGQSGAAILDFGTTGAAYWSLSRDGSTAGAVNYNTGWVYGDSNFAQLGYGTTSYFNADVVGLSGAATNGVTTAGFQFTNGGAISISTANGVIGTSITISPGNLTIGEVNHTQAEFKNNASGNAVSGNITKYSSFIGSQNSTMASGVINSVILGGSGVYAKTNNTAYLNQIGYAVGASFETLLTFTSPTANRTIVFQNASGTLAFTTDIPAGGVTSVSGTTNRITSTGGTTPAIDISATFEALLGKVANPLSQFASTTSVQLLGVISNPSGSGLLVFNDSPTFVTPSLGTPTSGTLTNCTGYAGANLVLTDVTTNNVSASAHGFAPKLPNDATKYMDGTGAYTVPAGTTYTFSTGFTNAANTITNNVVTGISGGQTWIGGTAAGDGIILKGTTGTGTSTVSSLTVNVGTNGGTTAVRVFNSGNFNVGNATDTNARIATFGQDTASISMGSNQASTSSAAIYFNPGTPSGTNYAIGGTVSSTQVNATTSVDHRIGNSTRYLITSFAHTFAVSGQASGAITPYSFTGVACNAQTASTETIGANWNFAQNVQHSTGALTLNRDFLIQARTHAFVGASTLTDAATFAVSSAPFSNTNATITNSHGILIQTTNIVTAGAVTNSYGITVNAMTGGTNNYAAQFIGGLGVFLSDVNLVFGTSTGTKIGTATSQKLSLWNAAPIIQPTTAIAAATFIANTSLIANDSATFDGYTIGQVVKALRNIGALA